MASINQNDVSDVTGLEMVVYQALSEQSVPQPTESSVLEQQISTSGNKLRKSKVVETRGAFFRLYKFPVDEERYLLEMYQVGKDYIERYVLVQGRNKKDETKYCINIYELDTGSYVVLPRRVDPSLPKFVKKYHEPLRERLSGWTIEWRMQLSNQKKRMFFKHTDKSFDSFKKVAGYILYACEPKDLQLTNQVE